MKSPILVFVTLGLLTAFVACSKETSSDTSTATAAIETAGMNDTTTDTTMTTEPAETDSSVTTTDTTQASAGTEQIKEGAKLLAKGVKEETRQAVEATGAAMEKAGEKLQEKAEEAAPEKAAPPPAPAPAPAAKPTASASTTGNVADGASVFKAKCVACHGADASGNTTIGKKNNIPDLRASVVQNLTEAQLATAIKSGKPGGMSEKAHASKALTTDQIKDMIAYLRSIRG